MNADYVISSGTDPMTIQETRHVEDTSTGSITVDTQTKLIYSFKGSCRWRSTNTRPRSSTAG